MKAIYTLETRYGKTWCYSHGYFVSLRSARAEASHEMRMGCEATRIKKWVRA